MPSNKDVVKEYLMFQQKNNPLFNQNLPPELNELILTQAQLNTMKNADWNVTGDQKPKYYGGDPKKGLTDYGKNKHVDPNMLAIQQSHASGRLLAGNDVPYGGQALSEESSLKIKGQLPIQNNVPLVKPNSEDEIEQALDLQRRQMLAANLAQAGGTIGAAISGIKNDSNFWDTLRSQTGNELKMAIAKKSQAEAQKAKEKEMAMEYGYKSKLLDKEMAAKDLMAKSKGDELNSADKLMLQKVQMGQRAIEDMQAALLGGANKYSIVGDNSYTEARNRFIEAIGRLQSGGAISEHEADNFRKMAPGLLDDKNITLTKLQNMKNEFDNRANIIFDDYSGRALSRKQERPQEQTGGPKIGQVVKGYVFMGGDPSSPSSWALPSEMAKK